jgi:ElaB/YqjD/DUF883 family membrane-anchored ribosome-binding protein
MSTEANRDKLISDVKTLVADADDLVKAMASATGEKATELGDRLRVKLRSAKEKLGDVQEVVADRAKAAARATDDFVHDNPWKSVGIAAAAGFLIGLLVNRR